MTSSSVFLPAANSLDCVMVLLLFLFLVARRFVRTNGLIIILHHVAKTRSPRLNSVLRTIVSVGTGRNSKNVSC